MSKIELETNIRSLVDFYRQEKRLFGRCPDCGESFRLSEIKITYGKEPPKDALARMKRQRDQLLEQLQQLEEEIEEAEDEQDEEIQRINDKWSDRFDIEVTRRLQKNIRQIRKDAIARGRAGQLGKTLEKIVPMFPGFGHHPYDVRPIFDPVDFVIFDGYFRGEVTDITFVEFKTGQSRLSKIQDSIRETVEKKRIHFEVKRLGKEAVKALTASTPPKRLQQLLD